jgi:plastocyanin
MSDTPGREPEDRLPEERPPDEQLPEERLPAVRGPVEPAPVERFTSPPSIRAVELTPERSAQIVRQSSNARWVGFLGVVIVILFITIYWFYELAPLGFTEARLDTETAAQQVTAVERGYNLFEANCARCHGANGEGGIGPVLNRQDKLFSHLSADYIHNVLTVGGRYVCGNANSLMPVWSNEGTPPGPLNYIQIEELIDFLRAPNTETYVVRDPTLGEPLTDPITGKIKTFKGWRDPNYKPAPSSSPYPACWADEFKSSAAPSGSSASGAPSGGPAASSDANAPHVKITASGIAFTTPTVTAPAAKPFVIDFDNEDASVPHNIQIKDSSGAVKFQGDTFTGVATKEYQVPALPAGTYPFACTVHPNMTGTLTVQ